MTSSRSTLRLPSRQPIGDQPLQPLHLGPHHRCEGVGAVGGQAVVHQPLGRRDAGHGRVDLVQPGPVLAQSDLDGAQLQAEVLDLLLLRVDGPVQHRGGGASEEYGAEQADGQRHHPADRRAQPQQQQPGHDPGPRPLRELLQPEDRGRQGAGQHGQHGDPDEVVVSRPWQRRRLDEHDVPRARDAESGHEADREGVAAQRDLPRGQHGGAQQPEQDRRPEREDPSGLHLHCLEVGQRQGAERHGGHGREREQQGQPA